MSRYDSTDSSRKFLKRLAKLKSPGANSKDGKYDRINYNTRTHWSAIEQALIIEMMKNEKEWSRSAMIRKAIHDRAMRTLGSEKYYKIINEPDIN